MRLFYFSFLFLLSCSLFSQTIDFEEYQLGLDSFYNRSIPEAGFTSGGAFFENIYTESPNGDFWDGWGISTMTDVTTNSFTNDGSAFAGGGAGGSDHYAVAYTFGFLKLVFDAPRTVNSVALTNSTYTALTIRDGNDFSSPFGGADGNEPDFFFLTIKGFRDGQLTTDSVDFYLADYRFADNSEDYIIDDWVNVDLSTLGSVDSLQFNFVSSDVGSFGINTPTYFCLDNLESIITSTNELAASSINVFPNPTAGDLYLDFDYPTGDARIFTLQGNAVLTQRLIQGQNILNTSTLTSGIYFLEIQNSEGRAVRKFVKR